MKKKSSDIKLMISFVMVYLSISMIFTILRVTVEDANSRTLFLTLLSVLALVSSFAYIHKSLFDDATLKSPSELLGELGAALKRGTTEDREQRSPATDEEIHLILNQLKDLKDEKENYAEEAYIMASKLVKNYRSWFKMKI